MDRQQQMRVKLGVDLPMQVNLFLIEKDPHGVVVLRLSFNPPAGLFVIFSLPMRFRLDGFRLRLSLCPISQRTTSCLMIASTGLSTTMGSRALIPET